MTTAGADGYERLPYGRSAWNASLTGRLGCASRGAALPYGAAAGGRLTGTTTAGRFAVPVRGAQRAPPRKP